MRVIVFGDQAAGKTTFLNSIVDKGYSVHQENLLSQISRNTYDNLVARRTAFVLYFFSRDIDTWFNREPIFYEYSLHTIKAFNDANLATNELTSVENQALSQLILCFSEYFPIEPEDIALHFICDKEVTNQRVAIRLGNKSLKSECYTAAFRSSLENIFSSHCHYYKIDTTALTTADVNKKILNEVLPWL